jgi:hypothetical protein
LASAGPENTSCFLDEVCYDNNTSVAQFSKAVAYLIFPDHTCSGTLVNDRAGSGTPYLLTAGHCIANDAEAKAMLAVFSFKTNGCNGTVQAPRNYPQVSGATLLARSLHQNGDSVIPDQPDFAFVRLSGNPTGTPLFYLGWTTSPNASDRMTSVSHPRNLPQRLAAGNITSSADSNFYSVLMFQGATDHGSSGFVMANDRPGCGCGQLRVHTGRGHGLRYGRPTRGIYEVLRNLSRRDPVAGSGRCHSRPRCRRSPWISERSRRTVRHRLRPSL